MGIYHPCAKYSLKGLLSPNSPKSQNFEKMKKTSGDIIILHMCTKSYDHMMYSSWDTVRDGQTGRQMAKQKKWVPIIDFLF